MLLWGRTAPRRPFDPERYFRYRKYWDYSGGLATDLLIHRVTRVIKSVGLKFPDYVSAAGGTWNFVDSVAEIPDTSNMMLDYPEKTTVLLVSSLANEDRSISALVISLLKQHSKINTPPFKAQGFSGSS